MEYDFSGWATRANVQCADGLTIMPNAFKHNDGNVVPLVWNHQHNESINVLGHAMLENRKEGVYAYCKFNNTESGKNAKLLVENGDISALSIFANKLKKQGNNVTHGMIREVSLVLAGANPEACIEDVIVHSDTSDDEVYIYTFGGGGISLRHSDEDDEDGENKDEEAVKRNKSEMKENKQMGSANSEKTIKEVFDEFTEEQKTVVYALIGAALEDAGVNADDEGGNDDMKHNIFDMNDRRDDVLMHDAMNAIIGDAKRYGSMKESFLQHADTYGIEQIDYLIPEAKSLNTPPEFIKRDMGWVQKVMGHVHRTPFSRIKSMFADITEDEARAKGYIKGKLKKEEVFSLLKRTTTPTTVYKKQKMDRDDVIDITDFDVISWLKGEMRMMLDEELARAFLVGDGRLNSDDDKIKEDNIRPIWKDEDLYTIKARFKVAANASSDDKAREFIRAVVKARKDYKGSGDPILFTTEDVLTDCLLLTDGVGRDLYDSIEKLTKKLRVSEIVTVPVMEGLTREDSGVNYDLWAIIVNLADYNVGADKGGAINMFDDFDIDYNQQKYLIETRCSGALTKPYSAIAVELNTTEHLGGAG